MNTQVLLVDDNAAVRRMIGSQLREWGYDVCEASDGYGALEQLRRSSAAQCRPSILLVDWHMPEIDGIMLCRKIKEIEDYGSGPHLYVLFFTVSEGTECETLAYQAGADGYIVKGSWKELEAKLNAVRARIAEEAELRRTIASLQLDPSGVLVKKEIIDRLGRSACCGNTAELGVVLLDIDDFKEINDIHGHLVGDQILEAVGRRLQESVRNGNVGRFGGDEFIIGLPGCNGDTTEKRAQDIVARLMEDPVATSDGKIQISISYGTAVHADFTSIEYLIGMADQALYRQKRLKKRAAGQGSSVHRPPEI